MDSSERMRIYLGERGSPTAQQSPVPDNNGNGPGNFGVHGQPNPLARSPSHSNNYSPSRSPGLGLPPPPGLTHHTPPQFGGYQIFDNASCMYPAPPGYFHSPPQSPLQQNGYGQSHFAGCGGMGAELDGVYSFVNMAIPMQQDSRFPSYNSNRKVSLGDSFPEPMGEGLPYREPTIENIVGSLRNTSTAGTYTHFGPMNPLVGGLGVRNHNNNDFESNQQLIDMQKQWRNQYEPNPQYEDQNQKRTGQMEGTPTKQKFSSPLGESKKLSGATGDNFAVETISPPKSANVSVIGTGKVSPTNLAKGSNGHVPRSLTPNGLTTSYSACLKEQGTTSSGDVQLSLKSQPQTTKPSYLEILTKNSSTNGNNTLFRRASASSLEQLQNPSVTRGDSDISGPKRDSPPLISSNSGHQIQPLLQLHIQGGTMTHRKLSDGFIVSNSSTGTSNSSTASSSPITKPKAQQKGKENYLTASMKNSKPSFTTAGTPTKNLNDKKGQNVAKVGKKVAAKPFKSQPFEFEIEDLDDDSYDGTTALEPDDMEEKSSKKKGKERKNIFTANGGNVSTSGKNGVEKFSSGSLGFGFQFGRKAREKTEKPRSRKEERNCLVRRFRLMSKQWLGHLISALTWLWSLVVNVATLSAAVGYGLSEDSYIWWTGRALPWLRLKRNILKSYATSIWQKFKWKEWLNFRKKEPQRKTEEIEDLSDLLAMLGPERNIVLPANGDEALRRLEKVKGQDPYSILGVRSNSPDETIRRYYKKQAVLVHPDKNLVPGAEEAFKILARAFELVGEPVRRLEYHKQLLEAHAKERFMGEFGNLFEQLRKKLESACTTIRCTKCNARHKKNRTNRPVFAARFCSQCRIHHGAREGELWAEKGGLFGFWTYYACMGNQIWEINEWGKCQSESLKHLNANSHNVLYRLVSGGQGQRQNRQSSNPTNPTGSPDEDLLDPEIDDWDNLINNLCRGTGVGTAASGSSMPSTAQHSQKGSSTNASNAHFNGNASSTTMPNTSTSASAGRKRKGKRK